MNCPACQAKTTEARGQFIRRKGQPFSQFVAGDVEKATIRTSCPDCGKVLGYRPGDLYQKKSESYS